jgi:Transposase DDE domain group 1
VFPELFDRPTVVQFDQAQGSSDGGAILLKAAERRLGIIAALADCVKDERLAGKVQHQLDELLIQRVMAIACGYEDANDAARLASDPVSELAMKRPRRAAKASGRTEHIYGECQYRTHKSWPWERRVIYEAEVVRAEGKEPKENPRFVVTNLKQSPQWIYEEVYCQREDLENRLGELHYDMEIGRTSCNNF